MLRRPSRVPPALPALLVAALATFAQAAPPRTFIEATAAGAELHYQHGIPIAVFTGSPADIGRQHAALLGVPARDALLYPKKFIAELGIDFVWPIMTGAGHLLMANAPEQYRQETDAFVAASSLDAGEVAVANTLLELRRMACSTLIVEPAHSAADGPLFGRNFDFDTLGELDKYSLVMVYRPTGRRAFAVVGFPATIGAFSGMNDAGLALATLDVEESGDGSAKFDVAGTPLALVFRRILEECATVDEAQKLLESAHATTWANLAVCDRDHGAVFEITPKQVARRNADDGLLACTNHFRTKELVVDTTCDRYDKVAANPNEGRLSLAAVQQHLRAASQPHRTLQTMIFEPRRVTLHVALGQPNTADKPLEPIDLNALFTAEPPAGEADHAAESAAPAQARSLTDASARH